MNPQLLLKIFLTIALFVMVTGCGASEPPAEVASESAAPAVAVGFTPSSKCIVPDVVGLDQAAAEGSLITIGLQPVKSNEYNDLVAAGAVISQEPAASTTLEPCQGDVVIVVSLGAVPVPTATSGPTETPAPPTETPIPTPVPPTATPTPDPRLFFDDFETGIRPEWGFVGQSFSASNGKLVIEESAEGFVGDTSWSNYTINMQGLRSRNTSSFQILVRVQDRDNYMVIRCTGRGGGCDWYKTIQGEAIKIPGTRTDWNVAWLRYEVEDNIYRTFLDNEQTVYFIDDTFSNGGVGLRYTGQHFELESFEVRALP